MLAACLVALMGSLAFVADVGQLAFERARIQHSCDAAALAGGMELPAPARDATYGTKATKVALDYVKANDPTLSLTVSDVGFRCIVGDYDKNGVADAAEINVGCPQVSAGSFTCSNGVCAAQCSLASSTNKCNSIVVDGHKDVPFRFAPVLGLQRAKTVNGRSTACAGACGSSPTTPLDVGLIIDRTGSMSATELANAKAAAKEVLKVYDPSRQRVALGVLGAADSSNVCNDKDPTLSGSTWVPVGFSTDYKDSSGNLNNSSAIVSTINCLTTSSQGTNLGSPLHDVAFHRTDMMGYLQANGRSGVKKGIILFTDGAATEPVTNPGSSSYNSKQCFYAKKMADDAKAADIEIFTIGFGIETELCSDTSGTYSGDPAATVLGDMATSSSDDKGHCINTTTSTAENADGDHFLCEPRTEDLKVVFRTAANALAKGVRLVPLFID